jgi:hypothetical protein
MDAGTIIVIVGAISAVATLLTASTSLLAELRRWRKRGGDDRNG